MSKKQSKVTFTCTYPNQYPCEVCHRDMGVGERINRRLNVLDPLPDMCDECWEMFGDGANRK